MPPGTLSVVVSSTALVDRWTPGGAAFTREYSHLSVEFTAVSGGGWGGYFEKVAVLVAGGTPPDIIRIATEGVQFFAHKGMLLGLDTSVDPLTGFRVVLSVFAAAVVGGLGSIPGAVAGALVIGLAEELATLVVAPTYKSAIGFVAILLVLTLRPRGLLGERAY